jgi:hypothetical protein
VPNTLVECVPNFSEGRDAAKVDAIVEAMKMPGVYLLDREMDADHNRCVITLVGEREAIQEAAIRGVGKAAELIDLTSTRARIRAWARPMWFPSSPSTASRLKTASPWPARGSRNLEALRDSGLSLRGRRARRPSGRTSKTFAAASLRAFATRSPPTRAQARLRRAARASDGRSDRGGRAQAFDRLQHLSEYARRRHRQEDRQGVRFSTGGCAS